MCQRVWGYARGREDSVGSDMPTRPRCHFPFPSSDSRQVQHGRWLLSSATCMATSPAHHQGTELSSSPLALPLLLFPPFLSSPRPREATGGAMATERSVILLLPIPFPCPQLLVLHRTLPRKEPFQSALHRHRHLPREKVAASVLCFPWRCPTFPGTGGVPNIPRYRRNHGSRLPTFAIQPGVIGIVSARAMWMKESIHSNSLIQFDQILIMRYKERKKKNETKRKKILDGYGCMEKYYTGGWKSIILRRRRRRGSASERPRRGLLVRLPRRRRRRVRHAVHRWERQLAAAARMVLAGAGAPALSRSRGGPGPRGVRVRRQGVAGVLRRGRRRRGGSGVAGGRRGLVPRGGRRRRPVGARGRRVPHVWLVRGRRRRGRRMCCCYWRSCGAGRR